MKTEFPETLAAKTYPVEFNREMQATLENGTRLEQKYPKLHKQLTRELDMIRGLHREPTFTLARLEVLANSLAKKIAPVSPCHSKCSACCHVSVQISTVEAKAIGKAIGIPALPTPPLDINKVTAATTAAAQDRWFGTPCPFLMDGLCSIYAHRPLACRLHFNLGATPFFCGTNIQPSHSFVANYNLNDFWNTYTLLLGTAGIGDIREYFRI